MVVAQGETRRRARIEAAEVLRHALPDRLQRLPPARAGRGVGADEFARTMVDGDEDAGAPLSGRDGLRHVGSPDLIHLFGHDRPVMRARRPQRRSMRGEQTVRLHDPPHPARRRPDAPKAQPRPDLAIAFP